MKKKDVIVYKEDTIGAKVLMNWFFTGQQELFKEIYFENVSKSENDYFDLMYDVYENIHKKYKQFSLYERKDHESRSGFSYQEVVLHMKVAFDIQTKIFINLLKDNDVDIGKISMLKILPFSIHMSTNSSNLYYNAMKHKYLDFIHKNNIKIDFEDFNSLEDIHKKSSDFLEDDSYFYNCEKVNLFIV